MNDPFIFDGFGGEEVDPDRYMPARIPALPGFVDGKPEAESQETDEVAGQEHPPAEEAKPPVSYIGWGHKAGGH